MSMENKQAEAPIKEERVFKIKKEYKPEDLMINLISQEEIEVLVQRRERYFRPSGF